MSPLTEGVLRSLRELGDSVLGPRTAAFRPVTFTPENRRLKRWEAWALVLGVYAVIFARHAVYSVGVALGDPLTPSGSPALERIGLHSAYVLLAVASVLVLLRRGKLSLDQVGLGGVWDRPRVALNVRVACFASVASAAGVSLATVIGVFLDRPGARYPLQPLDDPLSWAAEMFAGAAAGFEEELPLILVLVWALRSARYSWLVVCVVAAVLRVSFHLYYGWEAMGMFVWPVLLVVLYARTGAIWGIIAAHAWFNLSGMSATYLLEAGEPLAVLFLVARIAPDIGALVFALKAVKAAVRRSAEQTPAATVSERQRSPDGGARQRLLDR